MKKRNATKYVFLTVLLVACIFLAGCMPQEPQNIPSAEDAELQYLESLDELGQVSEGMQFWYDVHSRNTLGICQLDERWIPENMDGYLICYGSDTDKVDVEIQVENSILTLKMPEQTWRVKEKGLLAMITFEKGLFAQNTIRVDNRYLKEFLPNEPLDSITVGYADWDFLLNAPEGQLSEDVITEINFLFQPDFTFSNHGVSNPNALHCFMTSSYDAPQDMNLKEFLRHFPLQTVLQEGEGDALVASDLWKESWGDFTIETMPVPVHQFKVEEINRVLEYYMGIHLEDLNGESTAEVFYFDEAYYNFVSDYGPGVFVCESGVKDGDTVKLTSTAYDDMYGERQPVQVVLKEQDGRYLIQSRKAVE